MVRAVEPMPAYVLHSVPYKETSLVVELWTRDRGKVSAVAKGAKRPYSSLKTVLLSFQPLLVTLSGRSEVKTLTGAEWVGGHLPPQNEGLFAAYYLNELLMRGMLREDPHPVLFDAYALAIASLASGYNPAPTLRMFEMSFLRELGYGLDLERDIAGEFIKTEHWYALVPRLGWKLLENEDDGMLRDRVSGALIEHLVGVLAGDSPMTVELASVLRPLTREQLADHLGHHSLMTRLWMEQLKK
jgi:DNA repair protein RecO (recombination protein O)